MIDVNRFSSLVSSIYDCALDPAGWDETLRDLCETIDTVYAALHLVRFPDAGADQPPDVRSIQTPWDPVWLDRLLLQLDTIPAFDAMRAAPYRQSAGAAPAGAG